MFTFQKRGKKNIFVICGVDSQLVIFEHNLCLVWERGIGPWNCVCMHVRASKLFFFLCGVMDTCTKRKEYQREPTKTSCSVMSNFLWYRCNLRGQSINTHTHSHKRTFATTSALCCVPLLRVLSFVLCIHCIIIILGLTTSLFHIIFGLIVQSVRSVCVCGLFSLTRVTNTIFYIHYFCDNRGTSDRRRNAAHDIRVSFWTSRDPCRVQ